MMSCRFHHPRWESEEHLRLQHAANEEKRKNWHRGRTYSREAWGSGWQKEAPEQGQGDSKWDKEAGQGTGRSSWQNEQQPKTFVYKDLDGYHHIKMQIPSNIIDSIRRSKSRENRDANELLTRITDAGVEMLDCIHDS